MKYLATFFVLLGTWLLLAGFVVEELIVGGALALIITIIITNHTNYKFDLLFPVKLIQFLVVYIPVFVYKLILANIDIASRVLRIKIPLNPGFVKVNTNLESDYAKLTLANSITLTPGTLTVDIDNDSLYVHCVDVKQQEKAELEKQISSTFEKILGGIFK